MIEFKIIACPDRSQQATYQHAGKEITFGRTQGEMIIDDPGLGDAQLKVWLEGSQAFLTNLHSDVEIRLNGKPIRESAMIKEKDNITVARTTINFSRLDQTPIRPPAPFEHEHARARFGSEGSREKAIMDSLQYLENNSGEVAASGGKPPPLPPAGFPKPPPLPGKKG